jgi:hypothetical protein
MRRLWQESGPENSKLINSIDEEAKSGLHQLFLVRHARLWFVPRGDSKLKNSLLLAAQEPMTMPSSVTQEGKRCWQHVTFAYSDGVMAQ